MMERTFNLTTALELEIRNINTQTSEYLQNYSYISLTPIPSHFGIDIYPPKMKWAKV